MARPPATAEVEQLRLLRAILVELRAIRSVLELAEGVEPAPACGRCGSTRLEDHTAMGEAPALTCLECGHTAAAEVVNG